MKLLFGVIAGLMSLQQVAMADHGSLQRLSREMASVATNLNYGARQVIGPRPSWRQRYAYEHISFLHNSAHRFQNAVWNNSDDVADDHGSNIRYAFQRLEHDLYYARQTFSDLFYGDFEPGPMDDHSPAGLERDLRQAESLLWQIRNNLP